MKSTYWVGIAFVLAACGDDAAGVADARVDGPGTDADLATFSLSADPTAPTIAQGQSGSTVSITLVTGDMVTLEVVTATDDVATTLAASISGAGSSTPLTLNVGFDAPVGAHTITVRGTAGAETHDVSIDLTVTASNVVAVSGKVVDPRGTPIASASLRAGTVTGTSDINGNFTLAGVTRPYALRIVSPGAASESTTYLGMTRAGGLDVMSLSTSSATTNTSQLSGSVTGITSPLTGEQRVTFVPVGAGVETTPYQLKAPSALPFNISLAWDGAVGTSLPFSFVAVGFTRDATSKRIDGFLGKGTATATLTAGTPATTNITTAAVATTGTVTSHMTVPAGSTGAKFSPLAVIGGRMYLLDEDGNPDVDTSLPFPDPQVLGIGLLAASYPTVGVEFTTTTQIMAAGANNVTVPAATPVRSAPVANAVNVVAATSFTWSAVANAVYFVRFKFGAAYHYVVTTSTTVNFGQLASVGFTIPASAAGDWDIAAAGPATIDDAARHTRDVHAGLALLQGLGPTVRAVFTGYDPTSRPFTTSATP